LIWSTGIFLADDDGNLELEAEFELDETVMYGVGAESEIACLFAGGAFHPVGLTCSLAAVLLANSSPSTTWAVMDRS
jgi:hypothetical protein